MSKELNDKILDFVAGCKQNGVMPEAVVSEYSNIIPVSIAGNGDVYTDGWWDDESKEDFLEWVKEENK